MELSEWLKLNEACGEAMGWHNDRDLHATWHECERGDWLAWLLAELKLPTNQLRLIACAIVRRTPLSDGRTVWDLLTDERSRHAVEVAERYANGQATDEELAAAWYAAWAADAARVAATKAAVAARDADAARAADRAAVAATRAAVAAMDAARAADADAARAAAAVAASKAQSDIIREMVDFATVKELWEERNGTK